MEKDNGVVHPVQEDVEDPHQDIARDDVTVTKFGLFRPNFPNNFSSIWLPNRTTP